MMDIFRLKKLGIFAGGVLFGTAGDKDSFEQRCKEGLHELYGQLF